MLTEVPRGTGRTTRLLKAIPNGGYYVVTHHNLIKYVNQAIDTLGRKQDRLTVDLCPDSGDSRNSDSNP